MRKSMSFRPTLSGPLESRLVLSAAGNFSALSVYKADLPGNVQNALSTVQGDLYTAFGYSSSSGGGFSLSGAAPAQYSLLQGSVVSGINNASTQITDLLSPLKKSKNLASAVQGELSGLATQVNGLLTQLNATRTTTGGVQSSVNSDAASLAQTTIGDMYSSVSQAVTNQVLLFLNAPGIATKPNRAFLAARQVSTNAALGSAFSTLSTSLQSAYSAYIDPTAKVPFDTSTFNTSVYTAIGTFNTTATTGLASSARTARVAAATTSQISGLNGGSVDQVIVGWTSSLGTGTYPPGFVNTALAALDSVLQQNLASTGGA